MKRPPNKAIEPLLVKRRVRGKRRPGLERLMNALGRACFFAAVLVVLAYLTAAALRPLLLDREEKAEVRRLSAAVGAAEAANADLDRRIRMLKTPKGIEVEARGLGWVRPGEVLIQTSGQPPGPPTKAGKPQHAPPLGAVGQRGTLPNRFLDWLSAALGCRRPHPPAPTNLP